MIGYTEPKTDWSEGDNIGDSGVVFNRIESNIKYEKEKLDEIVSEGKTFSGDKEFQDGIKLDNISSVEIEGVDPELNKVIETAGQSVNFSASAQNSNHLTTKGDQINFDWFYSGNQQANFYSHYQYSGSIDSRKFLHVVASNAGRGGATDCDIYVYPYGFISPYIHVRAFGGDLSSTEERDYYVNLPVATIPHLRITQDIRPPGESVVSPRGADITVRRAKYPIEQGEPVKVFASDFSVTQARSITETDINKNRLTS